MCKFITDMIEEGMPFMIEAYGSLESFLLKVLIRYLQGILLKISTLLHITSDLNSKVLYVARAGNPVIKLDR